MKTTQLPIYEVRTDDGGVALRIGEDGPLHMGYDACDLMRLLSEVFPEPDPLGDASPVDDELMEAAAHWLDPDKAAMRRRTIGRHDGWSQW